MERVTHTFQMDRYLSEEELPEEDRKLLSQARAAVQNAHAPYSGFRVGAALLLENSIIVTGSNQENASFPAGICAERVVLSAASSRYPGKTISTIAVSFKSKSGKDDHPISPCGICRQSLLEYENRQEFPIRILMAGQGGAVYAVSSVSRLLPLNFSAKDLKGC